MAVPGYIFGGSTGIGYDDLQKRRALVDALLSRQNAAPQNVGEGIFALGSGIVQGMERRRLGKAQAAGEAGAATALTSGLQALAPSAGGGAGVPATGGVAAQVSADDPEVYSQFIGAVQAGDPERGLAGVANPNALAAIAATGQAESGYSPANAYGAWSDPSQSGQTGTAGGIMSWRAERLANMRAFAADNGDDPNRPSPATQAKFLLAEDPALIQRLNTAGSVEEAQAEMNRAWKFAGYDQPGGEAARRLATAQSYLPKFAGQEQPDAPVQVASLNPAAGIEQPNAAPPVGRAAVQQALDARPAAAPPAPRESVQRVAQAMPEAPGFDVPPEALQALSNPFLTDGQRQALQIGIQQRQRGREAAYDRQMAIYQQSAAAQKLEEQRQNELVDYRRKKEIDQELAASGASVELGLNPQYGVDKDGNPVLIQMSKGGKAVQSQLPEGVTLSKQPIKLDAGTHFVLLDPITRRPVGQIPKDIAGAAAQEKIGAAQGERQLSAPADFQSAQNALDLIDSIRNDPYRERGTGGTSLFNAIPGTGGYDFAGKVEQAKSGAFLTAIQQMKGMGALSNTEGSAATAAITRMDAASSEEGFLAALDDYEKIVRQAMARAQGNMAPGQPQAAAPAAASPAPGNYRWNPQSGQMEPM